MTAYKGNFVAVKREVRDIKKFKDVAKTFRESETSIKTWTRNIEECANIFNFEFMIFKHSVSFSLKNRGSFLVRELSKVYPPEIIIQYPEGDIIGGINK